MTSLVSLRFLVLSVLLVYILTLLLQPSGFMTHLFSQLLLFSLDLCVLGSALNTLDSSLLCLAVLPGLDCCFSLTSTIGYGTSKRNPKVSLVFLTYSSLAPLRSSRPISSVFLEA